MKTILIAIVLAFSFSGCMTNEHLSQQFTSSQIGCNAEDIQIIDERAAMFTGMHTWNAKCNGKEYICTYQQTAGAKCVELMSTNQIKTKAN